MPSVELTQSVDAGALRQRAERLGQGLAANVVAAAAAALRTVPRLNASYRDAQYELYSRINIGVTLGLEGPPTTPTIFDADAKTVEEIAQELTDLAARAREGELNPAELAGATFTIVDSSAHDILAAAPLIQPPQAGALSFGPPRTAAVVRGGELVAGHTLVLVLAVDHRIVHGHHGALFLEEMKAHLEEGQS